VEPKILATGWYLPSRVVSNDELSQSLNTSDEWIRSHTGIAERRIASPEESASDLGLLALNDALARANLPASQLDLIIVATSTPDYLSFPSTASIIQARSGASRAGAFDISVACSGFSYGLELARSMIVSQAARYVAVIGAEIFSRILNWKDRSTCVLFGDGAGAVIVGPSDGSPGLLGSILRSEGEGADSLFRPVGGSRVPFKPTDEYEKTCLVMDGRRVYNFAVRVVKESLEDILQKFQKRLEDVAWIVPHQANKRIIEGVAKRMNLSESRFFMNIERFANTSASSIPIALADMDRQGLLKRGDLVVTIGFGAGLAWGANLFYW